ncbi:MAG: cytochrome d ubiquinol oxidase subunit II [Bacteroidales bacterium]|nr:cytochrome d ubiquinol oxidase subunit II [Bacteroidales bacterium]
MEKLYILQHYWWFLISFLAALLVALMFVQGGQTLLLRLGKTEIQRRMILNSLGRKWELTFTTLVVFGGAFFASFSLYYSTSFGGAYWLWMIILFSFIVQAVAYEYMNKPGNFLGRGVYRLFLYINGIVGVFCLGVAVATLFTGAPFIVHKGNITNVFMPVISTWATPYHGLEAFTHLPNLLLGAALVFLSRIGGAMYLMFNIKDKNIDDNCRKQVIWNTIPFLIFFLSFIVWIFLSYGFGVYRQTGDIYIEKYKYLLNMIELPLIGIIFLVGVVLVLFSIVLVIFKKIDRRAFWIEAVGVLFTVLGLFLSLGFNDTAYYPSIVDPQSSLTIYNSSSSLFTLEVMSWVSILLPIIGIYGFFAWRAMDKKQITPDEISGTHDSY